MTEELGFAVKVKEYKKHPEQYLGSIVDVTNLLRITITGRQNSPDLWEVSKVLGTDCITRRIQVSIQK